MDNARTLRSRTDITARLTDARNAKYAIELLMRHPASVVRVSEYSRMLNALDREIVNYKFILGPLSGS